MAEKIYEKYVTKRYQIEILGSSGAIGISASLNKDQYDAIKFIQDTSQKLSDACVHPTLEIKEAEYPVDYTECYGLGKVIK